MIGLEAAENGVRVAADTVGELLQYLPKPNKFILIPVAESMKSHWFSVDCGGFCTSPQNRIVHIETLKT